MAGLASLASLEELSIGADALSAASIEALFAIAHLKRLHTESHAQPDATAGLALNADDWVSVVASEIDGCRSALQALRESHPGIVIDSDTDPPLLFEDQMLPPGCRRIGGIDYRLSVWLPIRGVFWLPPAARAQVKTWAAE